MALPQPRDRDRQQFFLLRWGQQWLGAVTFYTCIPIPSRWSVNFEGIARFAPLVGIAIGGLLTGVDRLLAWLALPPATHSWLLVLLGLLITGGLHLDGAMDTADGLAVPSPERRLTVMADSHSGAFGVMAAIAILGLKGVSLGDLATMRGFAICAAMGWGRWGQVVAIARYPYLKAEGKGAFHKAHARPATDWLIGVMALLLLLVGAWWLWPERWLWLLSTSVGSCAIALLTGAWFNRQLGGQTGDTYGAIVEWSETLSLCLMVALQTTI